MNEIKEQHTEIADTSNIVKSCLVTDERYITTQEEDIKVADENGNILLPEYSGNLPNKMNVQSKKIKLRIQDNNKEFSILRTSTEDKCNCDERDCS